MELNEVIGSPKVHKLVTHIVDYIKWCGTLRRSSEQSIEDMHQLVKHFYKFVQHLHGKIQLRTLEQRVTNKNLLFPLHGDM